MAMGCYQSMKCDLHQVAEVVSCQQQGNLVAINYRENGAKSFASN